MASILAACAAGELTPAKPVRHVLVDKDGVDPLPAYLAAHPEAVDWELIVIDTGMRRGEA